MRPKSSIYTPKRDNEHPPHFYMVVPPRLKVATLSFIVISVLSALGSLPLDSETAKIQATLRNLTIWKRGLELKFARLP